MAGPTTARRGEKKSRPGPPSAGAPTGRRLRWARVRFRAPGRRGLIIITVLAVLLGGFGAWALYASDWFRVARVEATGTDVLTPREVVAAADAPMDTPLISVNTDAMARRVTSRLPRVKSVDVERSWPDTIGLKVTERTPELVMREDGKFVEVDIEGVRFATVATAPQGVPLLELAVSDFPGPRRFGNDRLRRAGAEAARDLSAAVHRDVRTVRVRSYDSITLELTGGRRVAWGSSEQGAEKAKVLTALLKAARDARHFDVSVPSAPAASRS
ncbi:putative cell division protein FtsQ [Streptomyces sp. NBRC 110611]|uniref:cell division protein FtsQ/DivIB n=1 Tax=Streptomyces sp. NBRC 110611 TaxID=1621259 RepID=UPI00082D66BC|nr:FtsQ-type POTRA domain-containing protein [Streptomyces sp. NBRC 110611]GAU68266.1 putative cell division protein FtsQ [Streptomyces sp. NBRC 110611]